MLGTPKKINNKTFRFDSQPNSCRNLQIIDKHNGQTFNVERADAQELADSLEALAWGIRMAYGIGIR